MAAHLEHLADLGIDTVYFHCFDAQDLDQVRLLGEALVEKMAAIANIVARILKAQNVVMFPRSPSERVN